MAKWHRDIQQLLLSLYEDIFKSNPQFNASSTHRKQKHACGMTRPTTATYHTTKINAEYQKTTKSLKPSFLLRFFYYNNEFVLIDWTDWLRG